MPKIIVPTPMQRYTLNHEEVEVGGATVDHALQHLAENYPDIRKHLFNDDGTTRAFVNVYVNDEDSRYLQAGATPVKDGDTLTIVPSIAGGLDAMGAGGGPGGGRVLPLAPGRARPALQF